MDVKVWGEIKLRDKVTAAGEIMYQIYPQFRQKGYGKIMLKYFLEKLKSEGKQEVFIACRESNIASKKIIEGNGGILIKRIPRKNKETRLMYVIKIG